MRIINPSFEIKEVESGLDKLKRIEADARVCYKSEDKQDEDATTSKLVAACINRGHESIIEHEKITVKVVCDRGVSHEIVRHRIGSYSQESTRYCNYTGEKFSNQLTVIDPKGAFDWTDEQYNMWKDSVRFAEDTYNKMIHSGCTPQEARSVLPNSLKTEIVMTLNMRSWRNFFKLRTAKAAHPQMRQIAIPMLEEFKKYIPVIFDDIEAE